MKTTPEYRLLGIIKHRFKPIHVKFEISTTTKFG
jgi:hypothetical protein